MAQGEHLAARRRGTIPFPGEGYVAPSSGSSYSWPVSKKVSMYASGVKVLLRTKENATAPWPGSSSNQYDWARPVYSHPPEAPYCSASFSASSIASSADPAYHSVRRSS